MIQFDRKAIDFARKEGVTKYYLLIHYVQGPCTDDMCQRLLKTELSKTGEPETEYVGLTKDPLEIMVPKNIAKFMARQREETVVKYDRIRKSLTLYGLDSIPAND